MELAHLEMLGRDAEIERFANALGMELSGEPITFVDFMVLTALRMIQKRHGWSSISGLGGLLLIPGRLRRCSNSLLKANRGSSSCA